MEAVLCQNQNLSNQDLAVDNPKHSIHYPSMAAIMSDLLKSPAVNTILNTSPQERLLYGALAIIAYLFLASSLRFQRRRSLHDKYPYKSRESMSRMTDHDAWAIQKTILQMEFPFIVLKSLQFALFRVRTAATPSTTYN